MLNLAIILSWFACLATYLSSGKQSLLAQSLPKTPTWILSTAALLLACYLATSVHSITTACLYVLCLVMLSWIAIILLKGHWRYGASSFALSGVTLLLALLNLGHI